QGTSIRSSPPTTASCRSGYWPTGMSGRGRGGSVMSDSVIVTVNDHWDLVLWLLERLREQSLSQDRFEVLLVDNGSTQSSPPDELPGNVRILTCSTPGSYAARNVAIEAARGAWLVFTDADCLPRSDWLERLLHEAERSPNEPI